MGNSHSAATKRRDEERNRLAYLGDRYPFGDEEILRLARCHSYLRNDRHLRKSFLSDWAAFCATLPSLPDDAEDRLGLRVIAAQELCGARNGSLRNLAGNGNSDELDESLSLAALRRHRTALMQVVEGRILPSGFGRRLERAAFLFSRDVVDYHESTIVSSPGTPGTRFSSMTSFSDQGVISCFNCNSPCCGGRDSGSHSEPHDKLLSLVKSHDTEEIAFMRLEKFLEGASDCGRRGARGALKVLFKCCIRNSKGGHTADDTHYCSGAAINGNTTFVSAHEGGSLKANVAEVIEVGYSLSLAASFLSAAAEVESLRDINPADFIPEDIGTTLTQSLLSFSAQKKREIMGACYGLDGACGADGLSPLGQMLAMDKSSEGHSRTLSIDSGSTNSTNVHGERAMVTLDILLEWAERTAPCLSACLSTFMHHILFPDRPYPPSRTPFVYPDLKGQESAFFKRPTSPLLFTFACMSPSLGGWWHRLYTSESDGLSFNRLQLSLLGYAGPTLIIIRSTNGGIFGAFTSSPWKESGGFYGSSDCFLYQLLPNASVYRPRGGNTNFMYCNSTHRSKGYDGLAHGIGFGGTTEEPRLFIAESFDGCVASSADMTFESGPLLPPYSGGSSKDFEISDLEVWGVGGEEAVSEGLGARDKQRDLTAANIKKARKVDKAAFLDDFQSGMIDSKAFKHRDQIRGRADYCIDEHDPNNYVRDKRL